MAKQFRVTANFPILRENAHQTVIVEASSWGVALGKAARTFKRMPVMRRRRVTALSLLIEQVENGTSYNNPGQGQLAVEEGHPASEETVMEGPVSDQPTGDELNQQAEDEAERLIGGSHEIT